MRDRKRIAEELNHLRHRRDGLNKKIEELEKLYTETENAEILHIVKMHALSPEELDKLMARAANEAPGFLDEKEE